MAIGFPPKHQGQYFLGDLSLQEFIALAISTITKLGWSLGKVDHESIAAYTKMSLSSWGEEVTIKVTEGKANIISKCTGAQVFDWGANEKNINTFTKAFNEIRGPIDKTSIVANSFVADDLASVESDEPSTKTSGFLALFKPIPGYSVTPSLAIINIVIFFLMVIAGADIFMPSSEFLVNWGANFRPMTLDGEWWRLLTCCFLHIGVIHLAMNMYALVYVGALLEPILGTPRFVGGYLLTGVIASTTSLYWHHDVVSAGASGAIFGLYGIFLALLSTNLIEKAQRKALLSSIGLFVLYNLFNGLKAGIDNAAHVGGLLGGLAIGYMYVPSLKQPENSRLQFSSITLASILLLSAVAFIYPSIPNTIGDYSDKMERFAELEDRALRLYTLPMNTHSDTLLAEIQNHGIPNWNSALALVSEADTMDLPQSMHDKNKDLIRYCELRIKTYELLYKAISEDTNIYEIEIQMFTNDINRILAKYGSR